VGAGAAPHVTGMPKGFRDWRLISIAHERQPAQHRRAAGHDTAYEGVPRGQAAVSRTGVCWRRCTKKDILSEENNKPLGRSSHTCPVRRRIFSSW